MNILGLNLLGILTLVCWLYAGAMSWGMDAQIAFGWVGIISLLALFLLVRSGGIKKFKTRPLYPLGICFIVGGLAAVGVGLRDLVAAPQYEAYARIYIGPEAWGPNYYHYYDRFLNALGEFIRSPAVLGNAAASSELAGNWSRNHGHGRTLGTREIEAMMSGRLEVHQVRGTPLISINAIGEDPLEAASLANAVSAAFVAHSGEFTKQVADQDARWSYEDGGKTNGPGNRTNTDVYVVDLATPAVAVNLEERQQGACLLAGGLLTALLGVVIFRTMARSPGMS